MLYEREAKGSVSQVVGKLEDAAKASKFGVINVIDLRAKMLAKGVEFGPACLIVEVCNPVQAKKALERDLRVSAVLPCRISVYEEGGKVKIVTLRPTRMLALFGAPELQPIAKEIEDAILHIMDAACS